MTWHNESRRHALASKGVKTAMNDKPLTKVPSIITDVKLKNCAVCGEVTEQTKSLGCLNCLSKANAKVPVDVYPVETGTNVTTLLESRFPVTYFTTYKELKPSNQAFEDDGFVHVQRGRYRYVFYKEPQGSLSNKDVVRLENAVDKVRAKVGRTKEDD